MFVRLRQWRKTAAAEEGVPVYTIFTNEQLAEVARLRPSSKAALGEIEGIGEGRVTKYGEAVLQALGETGFREDSGSSGRPAGVNAGSDELDPEEDGR